MHYQSISYFIFYFFIFLNYFIFLIFFGKGDLVRCLFVCFVFVSFIFCLLVCCFYRIISDVNMSYYYLKKHSTKKKAKKTQTPARMEQLVSHHFQ